MITPTHSQPPHTLPTGAIGFALGIAGMLVSLYFSIMFIAGNATGAELVAGIVFCLILDYGKVALATESLIALAQYRLLPAVCYALIVISLYCLSMLAATFMLTSHSTSAAVDNSDSKISTLEKAIESKQHELNACGSGMLTRCINPRTSELNALQSQLAAAQNVSKDVIEAKDRAVTWQKMAVAVGSTPEELQVKLAFSRAILLEIIAPIFVSLFLSRSRNKPTNARGLHPLTKEEQAEIYQVYDNAPDVFPNGKPVFNKDGWHVGHGDRKEHQSLLKQVEDLKQQLENSTQDAEKKD